MIDIHSHILPFVDDGSKNLELSLGMLSDEVQNGVTDVILTPHYREPYIKSFNEIQEKFNQFQKEVQRAGIDVNLYLGREVFCVDDIRSLLSEDNLLMANSKYVLVEFSMSHSADYASSLFELVLKGYFPIIAHVERYPKFSVDDAFEIKHAGGFIQVNADSIVGDNRKPFDKKVKELLEEKLVDFVASDMHVGRINQMANAYKFVAKKYGEDYAEKIFNENAKEIIKG